ncbi:hypothetical protein U1Q18_049736 [Sarracenia purpurea var. burkii]
MHGGEDGDCGLAAVSSAEVYAFDVTMVWAAFEALVAPATPSPDCWTRPEGATEEIAADAVVDWLPETAELAAADAGEAVTCAEDVCCVAHVVGMVVELNDATFEDDGVVSLEGDEGGGPGAFGGPGPFVCIGYITHCTGVLTIPFRSPAPDAVSELADDAEPEEPPLLDWLELEDDLPPPPMALSSSATAAPTRRMLIFLLIAPVTTAAAFAAAARAATAAAAAIAAAAVAAAARHAVHG